jgi:hypothetical protein
MDEQLEELLDLGLEGFFFYPPAGLGRFGHGAVLP